MTTSADLDVAKKVVRRLFNPTPLSEKDVTKEAEHLLWAIDLHGYKVVSRDDVRLDSSEEANELPIGSVIVMHHTEAAPVPHPGNTWFRIDRGWINSYGSEVPSRPDWPFIGVLGGFSAVSVVFRADVPDG